ncbi:hypothetical protein KIN20_034093 [Parelaphostrongylus tenuis]|uniref:Uncharacterized protein n=1 Tax=Parelaphostrongylus tenuis TaxID=148309 RepID=A0AAD5WJE7_PARTN|nr:hypothetical protein KIN20_034093 [Parelaphostrongylus tenuis]
MVTDNDTTRFEPFEAKGSKLSHTVYFIDLVPAQSPIKIMSIFATCSGNKARTFDLTPFGVVVSITAVFGCGMMPQGQGNYREIVMVGSAKSCKFEHKIVGLNLVKVFNVTSLMESCYILNFRKASSILIEESGWTGGLIADTSCVMPIIDEMERGA